MVSLCFKSSFVFMKSNSAKCNRKTKSQDAMTIYFAYFHSVVKHATIFQLIHITVNIQNKIVRIMVVQNLQIHVEVSLRDISTVPCQYIFSLMNFTVNKKIFKQIHLYTVSLPGLCTTSYKKKSEPHIFSEKCSFCWNKHFQQFIT